MSYGTPVEATTTYKDLELRIQNIAAGIKSKLSWLTYSFGLADRFVEMRDKKSFVFPGVYQALNTKDPVPLMPSDLYPAFSFWVKGESEKPEYNFSRVWIDVSFILFCDLKHIAPTTEYRLSKTKIRQDVLEALRQNQYGGYGVLIHQGFVEDDLSDIYNGFSVEQLDNKYKMLPKYALRVNFKFGYLLTCGAFNTYA